METALQIEDLNVALSTFQLKNITLKLPCGMVMGLIGRNGAGKTTLIKSMLNLYERSGTVCFYGRSLEKDHEQVCLDIAYVGTDLDYAPNSRIKKIKNLYQSFYSDFDETRFQTLCEASGFDEKTRLSALSLGQSKLFQLYLAICRKPKMLILDEPMANLDPITRRDIVELLRSFMMEEDHAVLISSHLLSDLEKIADDIVLIDRGEIILHDDMVQLQEGYFEVFGTKEEITQLKGSVCRSMKRGNEIQALCHVQEERELAHLQHRHADLETIMYYLCERREG